MHARFAPIAGAFMLAFACLAAASDVIYLHCPTVFTKGVSSVKANYFKNVTEGGGPLPSCLGLNVTIDGQNALSTSCDRVGLMTFNLSTPVAKTYTIRAVSTSDAPWFGDGTSVECNVRRSSFNVGVTIPDISVAVVPFVAFAALAIASRRNRR